MNDAPPAANDSAPIARGHLGFAMIPASAITYHTILSPLDFGAGLGLVDSTWAAGTRIPRHRHAEEDEILIVLSGSVEIRIAGRRTRCGPGETAFVPRGLDHEVHAITTARTIAILTRKSLEHPRRSLHAVPSA